MDERSPRDATPTGSKQLKRRGLMAVLAGLGAGVLAKTTTRPAAAGTGDNATFNIGATNAATMTTQLDRSGATPGTTALKVTNTNYDAIHGVASGAANYGIYGVNNAGAGVRGDSALGAGVRGNSDSGAGVDGDSNTFYGVYGHSNTNHGVYGDSPSLHGVWGQSRGPVGAYGVVGDSVNSHGVWGQSNAAQGAGVSGYSTSFAGVYGSSASGYGVYGQSSGLNTAPGVVASGINGVGCWAASSTGHGVSASSTSGFGVYGSSNTNIGVYASSTAYHGVWGYSPSAAGYNGVVGTSENGHGVYGETSEPNRGGVAGVTATAQAYGVYGSAPYLGVIGINRNPGGAGVYGTTTAASGSYAGHFVGEVYVVGNFSVFGGAKSAVVPHPDGTMRRLYAVESPESWFEDFGRGQLVAGRAVVPFDAEFAPLVRNTDYYVFPVAEGDTQGLYVANKGPAGFEVREARGGTSNAAFSYRVVAKRKDIAGPRLEKVPTPPTVSVLPAPEPLKAPAVPAPLILPTLPAAARGELLTPPPPPTRGGPAPVVPPPSTPTPPR